MKKVKYLSLLLALALLIPLSACDLSLLQDSEIYKGEVEPKKDIEEKDDKDKILEYDMGAYLDDYHNKYGYLSLGLDEEHGFLMQQAYSEFYDASKNLLLSSNDWEVKSTTIKGEPYNYLEVLETNYFNNEYDLEYYRSAWSVFVAENPIFYFLTNGVLSRSKTTTEGQKVTDSYAFILVGNINFATFESRDSINKKIIELYEDTKYISQMPDAATKAKGINNYLKSNLQYAYKPNSTIPEDEYWAHSIIGLLNNKKGVCECYSKSYKLLADRYSVYSIQVYGYANRTEAHAWNYVKIDDLWYGVDVTWNENFNDKYLLCSRGIMNAEHSPYSSVYGIQYQPTPPTLSDSNYVFAE